MWLSRGPFSPLWACFCACERFRLSACVLRGAVEMWQAAAHGWATDVHLACTERVQYSTKMYPDTSLLWVMYCTILRIPTIRRCACSLYACTIEFPVTLAVPAILYICDHRWEYFAHPIFSHGSLLLGDMSNLGTYSLSTLGRSGKTFNALHEHIHANICKLLIESKSITILSDGITIWYYTKLKLAPKSRNCVVCIT